MNQGLGSSINKLADLRSFVFSMPGFNGVLSSLQQGESGTIDGAWGSSCALAAAAFGERCSATLVIVLPRISEVDDFTADLEGFLGITPMIFPAWETLPREHDVTDEIFGARLRCLAALESDSPPAAIVTCFPALLQPVPSQKERSEKTQFFKTGDEIDLEETIAWLAKEEFARVPAIELPGEFAVHGGILDIFPVDRLDPIRIELFGDEIESIRSFDAESQRKIADLDSVRVTAVTPVKMSNAVNFDEDDSAHFTDSLPKESWIVLSELHDLVEEGKHYLARLDNPRGFFGIQPSLAKCTRFSTVSLSAIGVATMEETCHFQTESIERLTGPRKDVLDELAGIVGKEETIVIACHNKGERERLKELFQENRPDLLSRIAFCLGSVTNGFRLVGAGLIVIGDHELFGRKEVRRTTARKKVESRAIDSFLELSEGDLVVHMSHGIGRFRGMQLVENDGAAEEHLTIEFAKGLKVFVPTTLIHLVQKYVGATKAAPRLSTLGTSSWTKKKLKVAKAVADMASEMVILQAQRESRPGISFPPDSHWMQEFEAAFPYTETPDQKSSLETIREDMQKSRPMDRLICGDVGYGKTEVAMRAAFRAIDAGKQVVVLVPTTVLAAQHLRTFTERMAEYPFTIEMLSRFRTKKEQRAILEGLEQGTIDLVIGTHRLIQPDVRLKDLGLLVIDEEQRFGVEAKEMLKRLRLEVDVLTLSATPIPRTLHFSLLGIRDISNLQTPPRDRQAIETRITRFDETMVRQAIVRELNRNGQVYFVHNRVYNIRSIAEKLQQIVPEARIGIVHGQMGENELELAMHNFVNGLTDILVATTIIESGLDIPNANTIFIHQANNYGLADLHQLRGRVGRYKHRAYCYLLVEEGKPLSAMASKRLRAIEEYNELGAGFKIAMRDLEIRGAGNILGTEQSGHISVVGYELYCHLLENAVRKQKNLPMREAPHVNIDLPITAYLPGSYVPPGRQKIDLYRKLGNLIELDQLKEFKQELRDRFGQLPSEVEQLMTAKEIQLLAWQWQIDSIRQEGKFVVFGYRRKEKIKALAEKIGNNLRIVDQKEAYLVLPKKGNLEVAEILKHLQNVLKP